MNFRFQTTQNRQITRVTRPRVHQTPTRMLTRLRSTLFSLRQDLLLRRPTSRTRLLNRAMTRTFQLRVLPSNNVRHLNGDTRPNAHHPLRQRLVNSSTIMTNVKRTRHLTRINNGTMGGLILFRVLPTTLTSSTRRDHRKLSPLPHHHLSRTNPIRPRPSTIKLFLGSISKLILLNPHLLTLQRLFRRRLQIVKQILNGHFAYGNHTMPRITMNTRRRHRRQ